MKNKLDFFKSMVAKGVTLQAMPFCLQAIWEVSNNTTDFVNKEDVIDASNTLQKSIVGSETEDGAIWDAIFGDLQINGFVRLKVCNIALTESAFNEIKANFSK